MDRNDYKVINMIVSKYLQYGQLPKKPVYLCHYHGQKKKSKGLTFLWLLLCLCYSTFREVFHRITELGQRKLC